jgi:hypothetical protein
VGGGGEEIEIKRGKQQTEGAVKEKKPTDGGWEGEGWPKTDWV